MIQSERPRSIRKYCRQCRKQAPFGQGNKRLIGVSLNETSVSLSKQSGRAEVRACVTFHTFAWLT
jgi:hypothetical protein